MSYGLFLLNVGKMMVATIGQRSTLDKRWVGWPSLNKQQEEKEEEE